MRKQYGFKLEDQEERSEKTDQETGHADSEEHDNYSYWRDTVYPMVVDFLIVYGAYTAIKGIACSLLKRGGT
ncbi:hypothetical protein ACFL7D_02070 [candidate division KSB1 bacterium]